MKNFLIEEERVSYRQGTSSREISVQRMDLRKVALLYDKEYRCKKITEALILEKKLSLKMFKTIERKRN